MKVGILAMGLGLFLSAHVTEAKIREIPLPRCQELAQDYAESPGSLDGDRLKQLQFCVNQTLAQQETLKPPTMLKGTIIEPRTPPEDVPLLAPKEFKNKK